MTVSIQIFSILKLTERAADILIPRYSEDRMRKIQVIKVGKIIAPIRWQVSFTTLVIDIGIHRLLFQNGH